MNYLCSFLSKREAANLRKYAWNNLMHYCDIEDKLQYLFDDIADDISIKKLKDSLIIAEERSQITAETDAVVAKDIIDIDKELLTEWLMNHPRYMEHFLTMSRVSEHIFELQYLEFNRVLHVFMKMYIR